MYIYNFGDDWTHKITLEEILENAPNSDAAKELREWLFLDADETWDAKAFDLEEANERVRKV